MFVVVVIVINVAVVVYVGAGGSWLITVVLSCLMGGLLGEDVTWGCELRWLWMEGED